MICQHCGAGIADDSNFCPYCGTHITDAYSPDMPFTGMSATGTPAYKLDLGKLLGDTFELYKRHFGVMCLVGLILYGVPFVFGIGTQTSSTIMNLAAQNGAPPAIVLMLAVPFIFLLLLQFCAQCYVILGVLRQMLYLARGGAGFQANQMFPPVMPFLKMVALSFIVGGISCAIMTIAATPVIAMMVIFDASGIPPEPGPVVVLVCTAVVCGLIALCAMIWIGIRLWLAQVFLADRDTGIIDSMRYSWRISLGNFWMLFVAAFVLTICTWLGFFLCCVGIILTITIMVLGSSLAYMQLTGQPNCLDYAAAYPAPPMQEPQGEQEPPMEVEPSPAHEHGQ